LKILRQSSPWAQLRLIDSWKLSLKALLVRYVNNDGNVRLRRRHGTKRLSRAQQMVQSLPQLSCKNSAIVGNYRISQWVLSKKGKARTITREMKSKNKGPTSARMSSVCPGYRIRSADTVSLFSSFPFHVTTLSFFPQPSLDDMLFSTLFKLSAFLATAAVPATAAQFNVTVGGSAGLVFTPQSVVSHLHSFSVR
jgi:hypothetical protein